MHGNEHLAIASVPIQQWGQVYDEKKALKNGTVFQDLNKPFFVTEQGSLGNRPGMENTNANPDTARHEHRPVSPAGTAVREASIRETAVREASIRETAVREASIRETPGREASGRKTADPETAKKREEMLLAIQQASFTVDDLRLYMDTHPTDMQGLALLKKMILRRKELMREYAFQFEPLTMDCMADIYAEYPDSGCYCWQKGPSPWEGACV